MEPNTKIWVEELLKQIHEEIKDGFTAHTDLVNKRFAERDIIDQARDDHVAALETTAAVMSKSFSEWRPGVDASISSVKLELTKLNIYFNRDVKDSATPQAGVLKGGSAVTADGSIEHRVQNSIRDCGFGHVYTHTHDPITGTTFNPQPPPISSAQIESPHLRDSYRSTGTTSHGFRQLT
jgi:hypothetical protein